MQATGAQAGFSVPFVWLVAAHSPIDLPALPVAVSHSLPMFVRRSEILTKSAYGGSTLWDIGRNPSSRAIPQAGSDYSDAKFLRLSVNLMPTVSAIHASV